MSLGLRFVHEDTKTKTICIRKEFVGFYRLTEFSAVFVADVILKALKGLDLDLTKLVGQGYDGCSSMAGKEGEVQAIIRKEYPKADFFHCASHKLSLVINDLNKLSEIQNTVGTIKEIIKFFRAGSLRWSLIPNLPLLCETRWTEKYKSVRLFREHFAQILEVLKSISTTGTSSSVKQTANQLLCTASKPVYIVSMIIIVKYSARLEPIANMFQGVQLNLLKIKNHIQEQVEIFVEHRENANSYISDIMKHAYKIGKDIGISIKPPRITKRQVNRSNPPFKTTEEYFCRSIYIPYLDSIISSLECCFSDENKTSFCLFELHPSNTIDHDLKSFSKILTAIPLKYGIENIVEEGKAWFDIWKNRSMNKKYKIQEISYCGLLSETRFYPAVELAIKIGLTLPVTTCTVERSFSTLCRVKTWLIAAMCENRLSGLCLMSVHRKKFLMKKALIL